MRAEGQSNRDCQLSPALAASAVSTVGRPSAIRGQIFSPDVGHKSLIFLLIMQAGRCSQPRQLSNAICCIRFDGKRGLSNQEAIMRGFTPRGHVPTMRIYDALHCRTDDEVAQNGAIHFAKMVPLHENCSYSSYSCFIYKT